MSDAILAIRPRALGDLVLLTPALRALKRGHPDAALELVTESRFAPLFSAMPEVDRVWGLERTTRSMLGLAGSLRRTRYRVIVDFFGNPRSALLTALCRGELKAGYDLPARRHAYRVRVGRMPLGPPRREYAADTHLRLARAAGGEADTDGPRIVVSDQVKELATRVLAGSKVADPSRTVGLVVAGSWEAKTLPVAHFALLSRGLMEAGFGVLLLAGPGEQSVTERLRRFSPAVRVLEPCDVGVLAGVIARLAAVVGNDSGPRHMAVALGVPSVGFFGPTHPGNWTPENPRHLVQWTDLPCKGCGRTRCPHWSCLPSMGPDVLRMQVINHLERYARPSAGLGPAART